MGCQMNKILITFAFIMMFQCASAQTWNEWFRQKKTQKQYLIQQIAALKMYLKYLKKGYDIAKKGLNVIGDIKQGKFDLDNEYLESLRNVNSSISGSAKVASIIAYQRLTMKELNRLEEDASDSEFLTPAEKDYVSSVYANMLRESESALENLERVLSNNELEMKDDERIKQVNAIYLDVKDMFSFSRSFSNSTRVLMMQRDKDNQEVEGYEELVTN